MNDQEKIGEIISRVLAAEGIEYEVDARGRCCILGTIAKPGASEEERREASRKSWVATGILREFRDITQKENGPTPLEQALAIERSFTRARLMKARLATKEAKEKGGAAL